MATGFPVKPLELVDVPWHNAVGGFRIADSVIAGASTGITFSSIPQTFKHLLVLWKASTTGTANDTMGLRFNSVSTANYHLQMLQGFGVAAPTAAETLLGTSLNVGFIPGSTGRTDGHFGSQGMILIPGYSLTSSFPTLVTRSGFHQTTAASGQRCWILGGALQSATAAVSTIQLFSVGGINLQLGSRATLYGLT